MTPRTRAVMLVVGDPALVERCRDLAPLGMHVVGRAPDAATYALTVWRPSAVVILETDLDRLDTAFSEAMARSGAKLIRLGDRSVSDQELVALLSRAQRELDA